MQLDNSYKKKKNQGEWTMDEQVSWRTGTMANENQGERIQIRIIGINVTCYLSATDSSVLVPYDWVSSEVYLESVSV